jgi:hypothetical protein
LKNGLEWGTNNFPGSSRQLACQRFRTLSKRCGKSSSARYPLELVQHALATANDPDDESLRRSYYDNVAERKIENKFDESTTYLEQTYPDVVIPGKSVEIEETTSHAPLFLVF